MAVPGKVGWWLPWGRIQSREEELNAEMGHKKAQGENEDGESAFKGGVWRAEALCRIRAKAFAAAGVCHLASITRYDQGLFDTALDKPALETMRPASADEVMAVDRKAMTEAFRLVAAKEGKAP